jgi:predicted nuclease of predicted toxin-antitoxin system
VTLWLDAHLSPALAFWFRRNCAVSCFAVRELGLRDATDHDIYMAARNVQAIIVTKDIDFVRLLERHGPPANLVADVRQYLECAPGGDPGRVVARDLSAVA